MASGRGRVSQSPYLLAGLKTDDSVPKEREDKWRSGSRPLAPRV